MNAPTFGHARDDVTHLANQRRIGMIAVRGNHGYMGRAQGFNIPSREIERDRSSQQYVAEQKRNGRRSYTNPAFQR